MTITFDLAFYYKAVASISIAMAGMWAFYRVRGLIAGR